MRVSEDDYATIGATLAAARRRSNVTQQQLAKLLETPQSVVSAFESGQRRIDLVEFLVIARALGLDPIDILGEMLRAIRSAHQSTRRSRAS